MNGFLTLSQMRDQIKRHTIGVNDLGRDTHVDEWINSEYFLLTTRHMWPQLVEERETGVTATSGSTFVYLPKDVESILVLTPSQLDYPAMAYSISKMAGDYHNDLLNQPGPIERYAPAGEVGRNRDFHTSAERITITPSSGEITTGIGGVVSGIDSDGNHIVEEFTITTIAVTTTNSFADIYSVSADGAQTKALTYSGFTSTNTYGHIAPGEATSRYKRLRLHYIPTTSEILWLYYKRRVARLTKDDQVPEIPISAVLVEKGIAYQYSKDRKWAAAMQVHEGKAEGYLAELVASFNMHEDQVMQAVPAMRNHRRMHQIVVNNG